MMLIDYVTKAVC